MSKANSRNSSTSPPQQNSSGSHSPRQDTEPAGEGEKSAQRYVVTKTDGSPPDPNARYLVLRLDTDPKARQAGRAYAEAVAANDPRLADAILSTCRAKVRSDWSLPASPRCRCGSKCRPVAMRGIEHWQLEWECQNCCDPVDGPAISWPFVEAFAEGEDFERLGMDWDNA